MKKIEVTENDVEAALNVAKSKEMKDVLAALFCKRPKPNLDDYKSIQTYKDACIALNVDPVIPEMVPDHIKALMKLETISRALWGKNFQPKPDAEGKDYYYYPWFALYTKNEIDDMDDDDRGALLFAYADDGAFAGFGGLSTNGRSSNAHAGIGFRLCQETDEKATYFGRQFIELWAKYLAFNFTTGDHLK